MVEDVIEILMSCVGPVITGCREVPDHHDAFHSDGYDGVSALYLLLNHELIFDLFPGKT